MVSVIASVAVRVAPGLYGRFTPSPPCRAVAIPHASRNLYVEAMVLADEAYAALASGRDAMGGAADAGDRSRWRANR